MYVYVCVYVCVCVCIEIYGYTCAKSLMYRNLCYKTPSNVMILQLYNKEKSWRKLADAGFHDQYSG